MARLLLKLEHELDSAYATGGLLAASLPGARDEHRLAKTVGAKVLKAVASALDEIGCAHRLVHTLGDRLGLPVHAYGDGRDSGDASFIGPVGG